jgi:hypothetical protein
MRRLVLLSDEALQLSRPSTSPSSVHSLIGEHPFRGLLGAGSQMII